ncbi:hypothetical protein [Nocardioides sp. TF02-7]|uniref:hypothetical protein n=1 Tax=Nocardioides sp. TF02-7 TaxID=2917724 RepID=UPI001F060283|nr:hypothetical protein [Nocardioides sp. TF02-7]UMG91657.1 hypothetical protein MF408_16420 [Nocardioides sp. TF02-7]
MGLRGARLRARAGARAARDPAPARRHHRRDPGPHRRAADPASRPAADRAPPGAVPARTGAPVAALAGAPVAAAADRRPGGRGHPAGWQQQPGQQPGWGTPPWQPPQQKKSRTGLIVGLAAAAVVLIVLGIVTVVALSSGDDDPDDDPTTAASSEGETTDTTSPTTDTPTSPTTEAGADTLRGTGYSYQLPSEEWRDVTDSTPDSTGTIDTIAAPGDAINSARGNILVETSSSYGQDDPAELRDQWKAVISQSTGATPTDLPDTTIGDLPAVGIELEWTNPNSFEVRQVAYLVVHGDNQYSITGTFRQGDDEFEQIFHDTLETWVWE